MKHMDENSASTATAAQEAGTLPAFTNHIGRSPSDPSRVQINAELPYTEKDYTNHNRPHTRGETWFNRFTHFVVDYLINSGLSIAFTHYVSNHQKEKYGKLQDFMLKGTQKAKSVLKMQPSEATEKKFAHYFTDLFTLSMVGHFLLFPIKALKDNEAKIVRWIDEKLDRGKPISDKEKAYREMAYAAIENKPKQTPGRVILSRIGALAINWGTLTFIVEKKILGNKKFPFEHKELSKYTNIVAETARTKFFPKANKEFAESISKLTIYEALSCALTAIGLKKTMSLIEKLAGKFSSHKTQDTPPVHPADAAPASSTSDSAAHEKTEQESAAAHAREEARAGHAERLTQQAAAVTPQMAY